MDLQRMLDKCRRGQWSLDDLDWQVRPPPMSREREQIICQYFTDMAGIERLAKELFQEQRKRTRDPVLAAIFDTFIADEERHAQAAERLVAHYDVHRSSAYRQHPHLSAFAPVFVDAIRYISAEFANAYITTGEVLLDSALLRGLADYVDDDMCNRVMRLVNRDESRHIAVDFHMAGYYAAAAQRAESHALPARSLAENARAVACFVRVLYLAGPFIQSIFVEPLALVDPSNQRMYEGFKRIQLFGRKPEIAVRPFSRFLRALQLAHDTPLVGRIFGKVIARVAGVPGEVLRILYSDEEEREARAMSCEQHARAVLALQQRR